MLYLTTREKFDAFTTARAVHHDTGPEGGLYLPYKMPDFRREIDSFADKTFGQNVADVLNRFFSTRLTGWDVEFCIGRNPVRTASVGQRVVSVECWRNLDGSYENMERQLAARICGCSIWDVKISSWVRIGIRIAVLAGIFAELYKQGILETGRGIDVSVSGGDFSAAMAVWYARQMGLPIENIICGCGDNSAAWYLINNGQVRPGDTGPVCELERLIFGTLGREEAVRFGNAVSGAEVYTISPLQRNVLRNGLFAAVVSNDRMASVIPNVYNTSAYVMEPEAAMAYAALMDYRARTGESRCALILEDRNPLDAARQIADAMNVTEAQLRELLGR